MQELPRTSNRSGPWRRWQQTQGWWRSSSWCRPPRSSGRRCSRWTSRSRSRPSSDSSPGCKALLDCFKQWSNPYVVCVSTHVPRSSWWLRCSSTTWGSPLARWAPLPSCKACSCINVSKLWWLLGQNTCLCTQSPSPEAVGQTNIQGHDAWRLGNLKLTCECSVDLWGFLPHLKGYWGWVFNVGIPPDSQRP